MPDVGYAPNGGGGAVPGFTPVDPGTAAGPGDAGPGNSDNHGSSNGSSNGNNHGNNHGNSPHRGADGVTVTVRDGDASFQVTTNKDGHFDGTLHGQKVSVDVDVADDPKPHRRKG